MAPLTPRSSPNRGSSGRRNSNSGLYESAQQVAAGVTGALLNAIAPGSGSALAMAMDTDRRSRSATRSGSKRRASTSKWSTRRMSKKSKKGKKRAVKRKASTKRSTLSSPTVIRNKIMKNGHALVQEYGGQVVDGFNASIGHSTFAWASKMRAFCGAIVKLVLHKAGFTFANPEAGIQGVSASDDIIVFFRQDASNTGGAVGGVSESFVRYPFVGTPSYQTIVTGLCSAFNTFLVAQTATAGRIPQMTFTQCAYRPDGTLDGTRVYVNLAGAKIHMYDESTLTLQNVTANELVDAEVTDVDALPLKGYSYAGTGSGAISRNQDNAASFRSNFIADRTGLIPGVSGSYLYECLKEPYQKGFFVGKQVIKPLVIPSGGLIRDTLRYSKVMSLDTFFRHMLSLQYDGSQVNGGTRTPKSNLGIYKLFALEKFIETAGIDVSPASSVKVNFELNHTSCAMITPTYTKFSIREGFINTSVPTWNQVA